MSVNDRIYDELLKPVVEDFHETLKALADVPVAEHNRTTRAWYLGRLHTLEQAGDRIADAIEVAHPLWDDMRELVRS